MIISNHSQNLQEHDSRSVHSHQSATCELLNLFTRDGDLYGAIHGPILRAGKVEWASLKPNWKLSRKKLSEYFADTYYIAGKRFNGRTSYLLIDVDACSPYHPEMGDRFGDLLEALEGVGLVRPVIVRSSDSGGLHLYFPLGEQVKTWWTAKQLHDYLLHQGFTLRGGTLELFPNPKEKEAQYNGHRLPLQAGSFLLNPHTLEVISADPADFVAQWQVASAGNELDFTAPMTAAAESVREFKGDDQQSLFPNTLPPISWTGPHQSNSIMRSLANWGYEKLGFTTVPTLGEWMKAIAPQLPGYQQHTSHHTKRDIARDWCFRWARSRVRRGGGTAGSNFDLNQQRADDATKRLLSALTDFGKKLFNSANQLFQAVRAKIQEQFGVVISKGTFQARKHLWQGLLNNAQCVGHDENSVDEEKRIGTGEENPDSREHQSTPEENSPARVAPTVDNSNRSDKPDISTFQGCTDVDPTLSRPTLERPERVGRVGKAQLQGLPNPDAIMATGAELKAAGIEGYGLSHTWTIRRGDYSADLWNRLRYVALGGAQEC